MSQGPDHNVRWVSTRKGPHGVIKKPLSSEPSYMKKAVVVAASLWIVFAVACAGQQATKPKEKPEPKVETHAKQGPAYLGIVYTLVQRGVRVIDVMPESPAERAGLVRGDVILKADGVRLTSTESLRRQVLSRDPGTEITLSIQRSGRREFEIRPVLDVWDRRFPLEMQALP